jgi:predicted DCC family thiol-disulfide oxidoreductase YuxK
MISRLLDSLLIFAKITNKQANTMKYDTIVIFDGVCNLCSSVVQFIIKRDPQGKFKFAASQSAAGQGLLNEFTAGLDNPKTVILLKENRAYFKSDAALHISKELSGLWKFIYCLIFVPRFIRDFVYNFIAQRRYSWFGRKDTCLVPGPDIKQRFIE